jgi:outer membrane protein
MKATKSKFFTHLNYQLWLLVIILLVSCLNLYGQRSLSLNDCISIALKNNSGIQSTENAVYSARLAQKENEKSILPQLRIEGKASHSPHSSNLGYDPAITDGGQYSAQLVVQEPLFDGGARNIKSSQLQIDIERNQAERHRSERDIRYNVTVAFVNYLESQDELFLQQQRVDDLFNYLELVKRLSLGGGINYTDMLKSEITFENAKVALQKSIQMNVDSKFSLAEVMGTPEDTSFSITGTLSTPDNSTIDSLLQDISFDSVHNINLKIADFNLRRSLLDIDIARSEKLPFVSLTGDFGLLTSGDNLQLPVDQRTSMLGFSVGVSVENLLFNWGITDLRIQQQHLAAENMRLSYEQQHREIYAELKRLSNQITSLVDQLLSHDQTLKKAEDNYALTKAQYAGGGTTALEVLSAEQLLSDNRLAGIQTRADLKKLLAKIEQLRQ